jgi:heme-degrading monooxygenase HmoA
VGGGNTIARVWRGVVSIEKGETYFRYLTGFDFRDYQTYAGNRGIHLLRRTEQGRVHFLLLSFWKSRQAIVAYAAPTLPKPTITTTTSSASSIRHGTWNTMRPVKLKRTSPKNPLPPSEK